MGNSAPPDSTAASDGPAVRLEGRCRLAARLSTAIACIAVAVVFYESPYFAGRANRDFSLNAVLSVAVAGLIGMLACGVSLSITIACLFIGQFRQAGRTFAWLMLPLALARAVWNFGPSNYESGFRGWVLGHIDPPTEQAIAAWDAGLPASTLTQSENLSPFDPPAPTETPPSQWPPAVARLAPHRVTRLADGVVMEWGSSAPGAPAAA